MPKKLDRKQESIKIILYVMVALITFQVVQGVFDIKITLIVFVSLIIAALISSPIVKFLTK